MAHLTHSRSATCDLGGNHHQDRRLIHDTTSDHYNEQNPVSQDTAQGRDHHAKTVNADDEEDSDTAQDGEQGDDDDEPEIAALSRGFGKGKGRGKRPAIRVEPVDDESQEEDDVVASLGTGLNVNKYPASRPLMNNKKRTFSNLSSTSMLFGDDSTDQEFPRRKMARKLSNVATKPLLTYKAIEDDEVAIESDDEDYSGLNLIPDDESDVDMMEQNEESFILQEEQQATALLNEYRDARRLSLESCLSDDIFAVTAPLDEAYILGLPDFGFAQFFEPEALPASPDPAVKRKYSDSSTKRVRFDDEVQVSDSSSSESSELDSSLFPDLFLEQDQLPPILHQLLENDNDDDNGDFASPQSDASFWDFGQDESRITQAGHSDESDGELADSSGYDCTIMPSIKFTLSTNVPSQLTWVIQLTKKIWGPMLHHAHPYRTHLSCVSQLRLQARELPPPSHSSAAPGLWAVRSHPRVVFSSMKISPRPLRSLTDPQRL
jgi:hypothetical protein